MEFVEKNKSEGGFYEDGQEEIVVGESSSSIKQPFSSSPPSQYGNLVHHHHHQEQQFHVGAAQVVCIEKEHMFDKVVTPSDVGKLNRLVIPKQHAEKYFPLDSTANEKGLLLNFEDTSGKPWRFRYSYWNSSQSYVMTKGWSRFVKEKKLDAGDIVSFERGADESIKDRFFIDWRRRPNAPGLTSLSLQSNLLSLPRTIVPWGRLFLPDQQSAGISSALSMGQEHFQLNYDQQQHYYHHHLQHQHHNVSIPSSSSPNSYGYSEVNHPGSSVYYGYSEVNHPGSSVYYSSSSTKTPPEQVGLVQRRSGDNAHLVFESVPVVHGKAAAKRVRLFGVNLECPISEDNPHEHDFHSLTTTMPTGSTSLACNSHMNHHNNSNPSHPLLQLRVFNGAPLPTLPIELPKRGRNSLSLDFDI